MVKNNFKPFAIGPGANVMPQIDWESLPALLSGFSSGKASSAQVNKALRQATFIASALAQFVAETLEQDVLDDGDRDTFTEQIKHSVINSTLPAGVPLPWPTAIPPEGWLKCNGARFDIVTYPLLAEAYPSGVLPDLRGQFIRGWDDGRGTDSARVLLSAQQAAVGSHVHGLKGASVGHAGEHSHSGTTAEGGNHSHSGNTDDAGDHNHTGTTVAGGNHTHTYKDLFNSFATGDWNESADHLDCIKTPDTYVASNKSAGGAVVFPYMARTTDAAGSHQHTFTTSLTGNHHHAFTTSTAGNHNHTFSTSNAGDHTHALTGSTDSVGTESRPENIAFNYIVRAA